MNDKFSTISFCRGNYPDEEGGCDEFSLINDISEFIRIAVKNRYQMKIWDDGYTICVEYNYQDGSLSGVSLEWLGENEYIAKYGDGEGDGEE